MRSVVEGIELVELRPGVNKHVRRLRTQQSQGMQNVVRAITTEPPDIALTFCPVAKTSRASKPMVRDRLLVCSQVRLTAICERVRSPQEPGKGRTAWTVRAPNWVT